MELKRRSFLSGVVAAAAATVTPTGSAKAQKAGGKARSFMTLIDLTHCNGCEGAEVPRCVSACAKGNAHRFPEPDPKKIKDYWPQKKHEDWSDKRGVRNRLTPYNWLFVQKLDVEGQSVSVPRRCMHCDNPPCVKLCPFGVNKKMKEGPVYIDTDFCFGGAKCRTVCPWNVPQRQAGVGVYTHLDPVPVGGGVMYKCDFCKDRLLVGKEPYCSAACPNGAMIVGNRDEITKKAKALADEYNGYLYGLEEHGGTSTVYVSKVPFDKIDSALVSKQRKENEGAKKNEKPMRMHNPENLINKTGYLAEAAVLAPVAGAATAFIVAALNTEKAKAPDAKEDHGAEENGTGGSSDEI